jgi:hypothetical protein
VLPALLHCYAERRLSSEHARWAEGSCVASRRFHEAALRVIVSPNICPSSLPSRAKRLPVALALPSPRAFQQETFSVTGVHRVEERLGVAIGISIGADQRSKKVKSASVSGPPDWRSVTFHEKRHRGNSNYLVPPSPVNELLTSKSKK